jgi:sugar lactone lactonase YvrE
MLRTFALALLVLLVAGSAQAPPHPIVAHAPIEIVAAGFASLRGIAVDDDDRPYVSDREAGTVTHLDADGPRVVARRLERPVGLALDPQGRVLVAEEQGGRVVRLDPGGPTPVVQGIKQPRWLAVSERGTVYLSARRPTPGADPETGDESLEPDVILALGADGTLSVFASGFDRLQGLAAAPDAIYAATGGLRDGRGGTVYRIPVLADGRAGTATAVIRRDIVERPVGLAIDRLGALYVSVAGATVRGQRSHHAIVKLRPDGLLATLAAGLDDPRGLAFDGHGHLYVADGGGGRLLRFLAPAAPVVTGVPEVTSVAQVVLSGATVPGARVEIYPEGDGAAVATTATLSGTFSAVVPLTANADNRFAVFATAARGNGLASPSAGVGVTHDGVAPGLVLQSPTAGAFVRGVVQLRADGADPGSRLAVLSLSAAGQAVPTTVTPPLPAPAAAGSGDWSTSGVADGTHTVTATATDRAGNVTTVSRVVVVDNTPPDTEIVGSPAGPTTGPAVTFTVTGADNLSPGASLQFAWRLDDGPSSAFTADTSVALTALAPGSHVFEVRARDQAGNEDPTPARRTFTVSAPGPTVAITAPAAGVTLAAGTVLVRGTVSEPATVSVNGVAALVHDTQWAAQVLIGVGDNLITAVARTSTGAEGAGSITVTGSLDTPALFLAAEPASGIAPLQVTWRAAGRIPRPIVRLELDERGDGAFAPPVAALDGAQSIYSAPGLYFPTVRATDDLGAVHVATTIVQADEPAAAASRFDLVWSSFKARLRAGDHAGALGHLAPALRSRFAPILQQLGGALPAIAADLGAIELIDQVEHLAEAAIVQVEDGTPRLYFIYFRRDNRGQWLIQEM